MNFHFLFVIPFGIYVVIGGEWALNSNDAVWYVVWKRGSGRFVVTLVSGRIQKTELGCHCYILGLSQVVKCNFIFIYLFFNSNVFFLLWNESELNLLHHIVSTATSLENRENFIHENHFVIVVFCFIYGIRTSSASATLLDSNETWKRVNCFLTNCMNSWGRSCKIKTRRQPITSIYIYSHALFIYFLFDPPNKSMHEDGLWSTISVRNTRKEKLCEVRR